MRNVELLSATYRPCHLLVFLALACLGVGSAAAEDRGRCVTGRVDADLVLPDKTVVRARSLRICHRADYSPVTALYEISVDNHAVGMYLGRPSVGPRPEVGGLEEPDPSPPYMVFLRNERQQLELHSYYRSSGKRVSRHVFTAPFRVTVGWQPRELRALLDAENTVVLSAAAR